MNKNFAEKINSSAVGLGVCFFVVFWLVFDSLALGIALGCAMGAAFHETYQKEKEANRKQEADDSE